VAIDLGDVNPEQKRAVVEVTKPVLSNGSRRNRHDQSAGASSRLCNRQWSRGILHSLSIIYDQAAKEVRERLTHLLGRAGHAVITKTFHSLARPSSVPRAMSSELTTISWSGTKRIRARY